MPMYQALSIFFLALAMAALASVVVERVRAGLLRPIVWLAFFLIGIATSAATLVVSSTRHSGTGFTTAFGWPKPFYFRFLDENGRETGGWSLIYFFGNALVFAGLALILWTIWRLSRARPS